MDLVWSDPMREADARLVSVKTPCLLDLRPGLQQFSILHLELYLVDLELMKGALPRSRPPFP
jgi:hypothetical protein